MQKLMFVLITFAFLWMPNTSASSWSVEADAAAYALDGYSAVLRRSFDSGFEVAFGGGRYTLPTFIVKSEQSNYADLKWQAFSKSIQVFRLGYRFAKPHDDGFSLHLIIMNQNWRIRSETLDDETSFRVLSYGLSTGYTLHIGKMFYIYPTVAIVGNSKTAGENKVQEREYKIEDIGYNGSVHIGLEF